MTRVDSVELTACPSRPTRKIRPDIVLPDGRVFRPRWCVAAKAGVNDKTLKRKNPETVYIGNVAYVEISSAISDLVGKPQRQNEPPRRRATVRAVK
jgi:hypothetical protein